MSLQPFDEAYVQRLRDGDLVTHQHFFQYFRGLLTAKLRRSFRSPYLIEDAIQETFLRALNTIGKPGALEQPEKLGAYVNKVCQNVLLELLRAEKRTTPMPEHCPDPVDPGQDPEREVVTEETRKQVRRILAGLSKRDQQILTSIFLEEKDKDLVCLEMGVDREYLRVLLHRALVRFRQAYETKTMRAGA